MHRARRLIAERKRGNAFANDRVLGDHLVALRIAYMTANSRVAPLLHVEMDRVEMLLRREN